MVGRNLARDAEVGGQLVHMSSDAVRRAYRRWAPVYDFTFGKVADWGRMRTVDYINGLEGRVLEVGIGTGISLPHYKRSLRVTAIDLSPEMLKRARERVERERLSHVEDVIEMDAGDMSFPDNSFDVVVAMYVLTVVPDPRRVMQELQRVCRPGGQVIVVNHFSKSEGLRGRVEKALAPFAALLGWRPQFPMETLFDCDRLIVKGATELKPFGLFTLLRFEKAAEAQVTMHKSVAEQAARPKFQPAKRRA
jgi:phosphatidylethanolamine/phosphatidyl-N-methylethanolamine N-methyltransferase